MQDALCAGDSAVAPTYTQHTPDEDSETSMPTLTDEIKEFIVRGLARFDTPSEVAQAVKSHFDVALTRRHVYAYDPKCTQPPAPRWQELHAATRAAFLAELAQIGVSHKAVRLRLLDRMTHRALANHYSNNAAAYLEQAAKECGGLYERKPSLP